MVTRWGGEEFLITMLNVDEAVLNRAIERFRRIITDPGLPHGEQRIGVTISCGATLRRTQDTAVSLLKRADELLYQGKQHGMNTTVMSGDHNGMRP